MGAPRPASPASPTLYPRVSSHYFSLRLALHLQTTSSPRDNANQPPYALSFSTGNPNHVFPAPSPPPPKPVHPAYFCPSPYNECYWGQALCSGNYKGNVSLSLRALAPASSGDGLKQQFVRVRYKASLGVHDEPSRTFQAGAA